MDLLPCGAVPVAVDLEGRAVSVAEAMLRVKEARGRPVAEAMPRVRRGRCRLPKRSREETAAFGGYGDAGHKGGGRVGCGGGGAVVCG